MRFNRRLVPRNFGLDCLTACGYSAAMENDKFIIEFDAAVIRNEIMRGVSLQIQGDPRAAVYAPLAKRAADQTKQMVDNGVFDPAIHRCLDGLMVEGNAVIAEAIQTAFERAVSKRAAQVLSGLISRGVITEIVDAEIMRRVTERLPQGSD
jgi:predicted nucleotide-binding protein